MRKPTANFGMFRGALASRRCLVPADVFYEWRVMPDGKQPYATGRRDGAPLAFAGLRKGWRSPDGNIVRSFAILTTSANATMAVLHDRMPVILEEHQWPIWLGEAEGNAPDLMQPASEDVLRLWPVSRAVNSVRNNDGGERKGSGSRSTVATVRVLGAIREIPTTGTGALSGTAAAFSKIPATAID